MAIADDFIMVRFATRPYGFMRQAHKSIIPWLELRKIQYVMGPSSVFFELPHDLEKYTIITPELCQEINQLATEIKRLLSALSYMRMKTYRQPLSSEEIENLAMTDISLIL